MSADAGNAGVVVASYHYPLSAPGGGTHEYLRIAEGLRDLGERVVLLPRGPVTDAAVDGVEIAAVHPARTQLGLARRYRAAIEKRLAAGPVAALLTRGNDGAFAAGPVRRHQVPWANFASTPSYVQMRADVGRRPRRWLANQLPARAIAEADIVFAPSQFTADEIVGLGLRRSGIVVNPLGLDESLLTIARPAANEPVSRLLFHGSLGERKGAPDAIAAFARIPARARAGVTFRFVGWGDHDALRQVAAAAGVADDIELVPPVAHGEMRAHLQWAQVAVLPSHWESFGFAVVESQAAGLPVITTTSGSIPEVTIDGETAWTVGAGDVDELAAAIEAALGDAAEVGRRGTAGRAFVAERFRWERTCRVVQETLGLGGSPG